jgi:hypothetical protein
MRFMLLVKANKNFEAGVWPDEKLLAEMASGARSSSRPAPGSRPAGSSRARKACASAAPAEPSR